MIKSTVCRIHLCPDLNKKVFNSSLVLLHPKSIYSIEMGAMLLKQCICHIALHSIIDQLINILTL
jgi:hypothetical protein